MVSGRVAAGRVVAAADVAAGEADPEVEPLAAVAQAVLAAVDGHRQLPQLDLVQMRAELAHPTRTRVLRHLGPASSLIYPRPMHTLAEVETAIKESWSFDTAEEDDGWTPDNPSRGQCDVTSLVVHDIFGGELLAAEVSKDGRRVEWHMWNRLPGGLEIDLTRDQFRDGEVIGAPTPRPRTPEIARPEHPRYHRYQAYLVLAARVRRRLGADA